MKIAVIGYGDSETPSHRFRFQAYSKLLQSEGHEFIFVYKSDVKEEHFWNKLSEADIIINQKCLLPANIGKRIFSLGKPVFFDFDDAIWTRPGKPYSWLTQTRVNTRLKFWLSKSQGILTANSYLADKASEYSQHVSIVPMALDTNYWKPTDNLHERFTVGWIGAPHNLYLLNDIANPLSHFLNAEKTSELAVYSGEKPTFPFDFRYVKFNDEEESTFVQSLSVGLLPLDNHPYSRGKSPIKALQYLACGVPVVANRTEGSQDFLNDKTCLTIKDHDDWAKKLRDLSEDPERRKSLSKAGLEMIQSNHSINAVFPRFMEAVHLV